MRNQPVQSPPVVEKRRSSAPFWLSLLSLLLATTALVVSGVTLRRMTAMEDNVNSLREEVNRLSLAPAPAPVATPSPTTVPSPPVVIVSPTTNPTISPSPSSAETDSNLLNSTFVPGQFVSPAFGTNAEIELLSAQRVTNPDNGGRNVVNVQFRIRRLAEKLPSGQTTLTPSQATARNPANSETYKIVNSDRATPPVSLSSISRNASADAYVWLQVPPEVKSLDIYLPNTQVFRSVPIADSTSTGP